MTDRPSPGAACALIAFEGTRVEGQIPGLIADPRVAGVTLYGSNNIENAAQTRLMTTDLQRAAGRLLLIAVDQEGGQLTAAGPDTTHFAGNMAIGAVGDEGLAWRVGAATGLELAALGINLNYAPVADIASRPDNPSLGIRSFGEDPAEVSRLTAAMVKGLQSSGVAATLKHFPGKGEAQVDPHLELPVLDLDLERLNRVEFAPFRAGIEAGARFVMIGHYGLPAITGNRHLPSSASSAVLRGLIRDQLGFEGVIVTDALDMGAFQGVSLEEPLSAGCDLLLYGPAQAGTLPIATRSSSLMGGGPDALPPRLDSVLAWLAGFPQPDPSVIGSSEHAALAAELAARSITLVRDDQHRLPLKLSSDSRVLALMPRPTDLTPADTSSLVAPGLGSALRVRHPATAEITVSYSPTDSEIAAVVATAESHDVVIVGTIDANDAQKRLVRLLLGGEGGMDRTVITVSLRTPYDLASYSEASTHLAAYGIHPPTMTALVDALLGLAPVSGRLPVAIPGLYPIGHGLTRPE
jgi:beta-N-acetylhexosaminidase